MNRKNHILIICNEFPPCKRIGGIGRLSKIIADSLVNNSFKCTVLGLYTDIDHDQDYTQENGVRVVKVSIRRTLPGIGFIIGKIKLNRWIKKINEENNIDIIEAPDYEGNFWLMRTFKSI